MPACLPRCVKCGPFLQVKTKTASKMNGVGDVEIISAAGVTMSVMQMACSTTTNARTPADRLVVAAAAAAAEAGPGVAVLAPTLVLTRGDDGMKTTGTPTKMKVVLETVEVRKQPLRGEGIAAETERGVGLDPVQVAVIWVVAAIRIRRRLHESTL
jgi:hypothetical protein